MSTTIRVARLDDIEAMQTVERAAGCLFAPIGMEDVAAHAPLWPRFSLAIFVTDGHGLPRSTGDWWVTP